MTTDAKSFPLELMHQVSMGQSVGPLLAGCVAWLPSELGNQLVQACVELDESALLGSDLFNPLIQSTCGLLNALDGLDSSFEVTSPLAQLHVKLSHG
jgi:hypothetical protein